MPIVPVVPPFPLAPGDYFGPSHHSGCGPQPDTQSVVNIQSELNSIDLRWAIRHGSGAFASLRLDGCYGPATQSAVRWVQGQIRAVQDGLVGATTWRGMFTYNP